MIKVTAVIKVEFEVDSDDQETVRETLNSLLEYKIENDELMEDAKLKFKDLEDDDDYEDEDDDT